MVRYDTDDSFILHRIIIMTPTFRVVLLRPAPPLRLDFSGIARVDGMP